MDTRILIAGILIVLAACGRVGSGRYDAPIIHDTNPVEAQARTDSTPPASQSARDLLASAPAVQAARARWLAAIQRARLSGVLPDPMVTGEYMRIPDLGMDGVMLEVEQPLPRWGERDAERTMAAARIAMAQAEYALARGRTLAAIGAALAEAEAADAQVALDHDVAERARALSDLLARSAVAAGKGTIREPLSLQTRATESDLMALRDQRMAEDARGEANAMLGAEPGTALPSLGTIDPSSIDPAAAPEVRMAHARAAMAASDRQMAQARGRPEVAVLGRWRRDAVEDADAWEGGLRLSVPLWRDAYRGGVDAATADVASANRDATGSLLDAREMIARARRAEALATRTRSWSAETALRLNAELDSLAAEAATGMAGSTAMLFDRFDQLVDARRASIAAEAEARRATAALWALAPPPASAVNAP